MIKDLKELEKLLKLLRKQGITHFKMGEIDLTVGDLPQAQGQVETVDINDDPYAGFPAGVLTPEQLMYYSSGGVPEEDPFKDKQQ